MLKPRHSRFAYSVGMATIALAAAVQAADWPHWRGPAASGVAPDTSVPLRWSATENVAWKAGITGAGVSTPIVSGDRVYVTSQLGAGVRREGNHPRLVQGSDAAAQGERALAVGTPAADPSKTAFVVEAFNRADGKRLWERRIDAAGTLTPVHDKHNLATPSPVTDGTNVYAWFGTGQVVALDRDGKVLWQRNLAENAPFDIQWGHGSSPVLFRDTLILLRSAGEVLCARGRQSHRQGSLEGGPGTRSSVVQHSPRRRGSIRRRVDRELHRTHRRVRRRDRSVSLACWRDQPVRRALTGLPPGHHLREPRLSEWTLHGVEARWTRRRELAVALAGSDGSAVCVVALYYDGVVYMANDVGVLTAVDAASGERIWQERVDGVFSASPVAGGGHVVLPQRRRRNDRREGRAHAADRRAQRARRARRGVAGDLERSAVRSHRRGYLRDRQALTATGASDEGRCPRRRAERQSYVRRRRHERCGLFVRTSCRSTRLPTHPPAARPRVRPPA